MQPKLKSKNSWVILCECVCVCPSLLIYKQGTIHKKLHEICCRGHKLHFTMTTMTNERRCHKRWQNLWNIVSCALLTQNPTQGFFSVCFFYEKYINNLEVQLEKSFWAQVQEVQIFLPPWLNKEANLRTMEHFEPRSDVLGNVAVTQHGCFTVWAEKQSAWMECVQIPEQCQEEGTC